MTVDNTPSDEIERLRAENEQQNKPQGSPKNHEEARTEGEEPQEEQEIQFLQEYRWQGLSFSGDGPLQQGNHRI